MLSSNRTTFGDDKLASVLMSQLWTCFNSKLTSCLFKPPSEPADGARPFKQHILDKRKSKQKYRALAKKYKQSRKSRLAKADECLVLEAQNKALQDNIGSLAKQYKKSHKSHLAKVDECMALAVQNKALQDEICSLKTKLHNNRVIFNATKPFCVPCKLH